MKPKLSFDHEKVLFYLSSHANDMIVCGFALARDMLIHREAIEHYDVIKWKHFLRYWPFVRGNHRSPVNSPYKRPMTWSFDFSLIRASING